MLSGVWAAAAIICGAQSLRHATLQESHTGDAARACCSWQSGAELSWCVCSVQVAKETPQKLDGSQTSRPEGVLAAASPKRTLPINMILMNNMPNLRCVPCAMPWQLSDQGASVYSRPSQR